MGRAYAVDCDVLVGTRIAGRGVRTADDESCFWVIS